MEDKNSATTIVLAAIERNGGNLSFNELEKSTGLSFVELSNIIGQLMKENRLLARVNHFAGSAVTNSASSPKLLRATATLASAPQNDVLSSGF